MKNQNKNSVWTYMSEKAQSADAHWMTIFTPAYQREATMERLYRTLIALRLPNQDIALNDGRTVDFEWVIVNDGSTDKTDEMVKSWCRENELPIKYCVV